jgi:hypothetical protein
VTRLNDITREPPDDDGDEVAKLVDEVIAQFAELLPADLHAEARELLEDVVGAHPLGRLLAARVRDRPAGDRSQEHVTASEPPAMPDEGVIPDGKVGP